MNLDRIKKKQAELKEKKTRRDFWSPKEGPNEIRVLPHWTGDMEADFFYETAYHKELGPDKETVICLKFERNEDCPICNIIGELYKTKSKDDAAWAKQIRMQRRVYWNIVDLKEKEKGAQVWMTGVDVLEQVLDYCSNIKYGDITDPKTGRNITLKFTDGKNTKSGWNDYNVQPDPDRTQIENPEWLEQMADLTTFIKITSVDKMLAILYGKEENGEEEKKEETEKHEKPQMPQPVSSVPTKKSCIGKFSADDPECVSCVAKVECQEEKKTRLAPKTLMQETVQEIELKSKADEVDVEETKKKEKETEIMGILQRIKNRQKK